MKPKTKSRGVYTHGGKRDALSPLHEAAQHQQDWSQPKEVTDLEMAFPATVKTLLPPYDQVPQEFKDGHTYWNDLTSKWFFSGVNASLFVPKPGIDKHKAIRQIQACLGSFEPKHEHKEAGVAFLMSLFFVDPNEGKNAHS